MGDFVNEQSKPASLPLFSIADFTLFDEVQHKNMSAKDNSSSQADGVLTIRSSGRAEARR